MKYKRIAPAAIKRLVLAGSIIGAVGPSHGQFPPVVRTADFDGNNGFTVYGTVLEQFANSVTGLGDVNADGIDDFASGGGGLAWYPDCYCEPTIGMVNVIFGSADIGSDGLWTVDKLDGTNGFRIPEVTNPEVGYRTLLGSASAAGDFNNDGIDDFLVGAPATDHWVYLDAGACYVVYGRPGLGAGGSLDLSLLDGSNGFAIYGHFGLALIGGAKAAIKDFNADGVDDILLASIRAGSFTGQCYVIFGGTDAGLSGQFSLGDLSPVTGIVINGIAPWYVTGTSISSAGDVNGDGFWDIMIGTNKLEAGGQGEAYVLFGGPDVSTTGVIELSSLNGKNGFVIRAAGGSIGYSGKDVAGLGDVNGDGFDDVAMYDRNDSSDSWVDIIFGAREIGKGGAFHASALDGTNGFRIVANPPPETGRVSGPTAIGDVNADGFNDILVTANGPRRWILYGGADVGRSGFIVIDEDLGQRVFEFDTPESPFDNAGAGDVNNDGIDDIVVAMPYSWHVPTGADLGEVDVLFGRRMGDVDLDADVDIQDFSTWTGCMLGPGGAVLSGCHAFDFNHDGRVDLTDFAGFQGAFQQSVGRNAQ